MRRTLSSVLMTAMVMSVIAFAPVATAAPAMKLARPKLLNPAKIAPTTGDVTVGYYAAGGEARAVAVARGKGASVEKRAPRSGVIVVDPPAGVSADEFAAQMENAPGIRYAEPVRPMRALYTPNDQYFSDQWGMMRIHMPTAWDRTLGDPAVRVAIIDTGLDLATLDRPLNVDTANDWDFVSNDGIAEDPHGHGTHTAGIVAAVTNNDIGVAGIAPNVTILPIRVLDEKGWGNDTDVAEAIRYAADRGADVINLSLGGPDGSVLLEDAVNYAAAAGCTVVAAAGNDADLPGYVPGELYYPAGYAAAIAVGAVDQNSARAAFSQYGSELDLVAPGVGIWSIWPGNYLYEAQGTSEAAPHVAGVAALLRSVHSTWTANEIENAMTGSAEDLGAAGFDLQYAHGLVRADRALDFIETWIGLAAPTTCSWGGTALVKGKLWSTDAPYLAGREVRIDAKPYGSSTWSMVATATTGDDGWYRARVAPKKRTAYRAHFAGEGDLAQVTTGYTKTITPRAVVTKPTVPRKVIRGRRFSSYGFIRPKHVKGAKSVGIKCYKWDSARRRYRYHHTVWAVNQEYDSATARTRYLARYSLHHRGKWKLVAWTKADGWHATTYSAPRYVYVRTR